MPKFPKGFGRRKSTPNVLEEFQNTPAVEQSFKVFERPEGGSHSFDGGAKFARATGTTVPVSRPRTYKTEDNMFENLDGTTGNR